MAEKSMPMRVSAKMRRFINMLVGERQLETGKNVSADEALWELVKDARPDLAKRAEEAGKDDE